MVKTVKNFMYGIFGGLLLLIGFFVLFAKFWVGLIIMVIGSYLKYKSDHYVHSK